MRDILRAVEYDSTIKHVTATLVRLMEADGDITTVMIPDAGVKVGYDSIAMPRQPQFIMGNNPYAPEHDICYSIKFVEHSAEYADGDTALILMPASYKPEMINEHEKGCDRCEVKRFFKGYMLEVPEVWPFNAVVQCQTCYGLDFVFARVKEER